MSRLLDLFCGAGGAAMGYYQAGFTEIVGVDIVPQSNYPFTFVQMDALEYLRLKADLKFDLIHASPPCQEFVALSVNRHGKEAARWSDRIATTRRHLQMTPTPYVIENVRGAPLHDPLILTGEMFGLPVHRPRLFELGGWFAMSPPPARRQLNPVAVYGKPDGRRLWDRADGSIHYAWGSVEEGREALGVPWMTDELEIREAIPPAYSHYLGSQFLAQVRA